jgi:hypothetical protein
MQDLTGNRLRDVGHAHGQGIVVLDAHPDLVLIVVIKLGSEFAAVAFHEWRKALGAGSDEYSLRFDSAPQALPSRPAR